MGTSSKVRCPNCQADGQTPGNRCEICDKIVPLPPGDARTTQVAFSDAAFAGTESPLDDEIGNYEILGELGRGGMGVVYRVRHKQTAQEYALKLIRPELCVDPDIGDMFVQELVAGQRMRHDGIVNIYQMEYDGDNLFYTMEYVAGDCLRNVIRDRLSFEESSRIMLGILDALAYSHSLNPPVAHLDLKPENVMVAGDSSSRRVKILDFGLSRILSPENLSQTARAMGTAYYMAPEQLLGMSHADTRADLYSAGVLFYEMLTGVVPQGMFELPSACVRDVPAETDNLFRTLLAPDPERRRLDAKAARDELARVVSEISTARRDRLAAARDKASRAERELDFGGALGHARSLLGMGDRGAADECGRIQALDELAARYTSAVNASDWTGAEQCLARMGELSPGNPRVRELSEKLRQARARGGFGMADEGMRRVRDLEQSGDYAGAQKAMQEVSRVSPPGHQSHAEAGRLRKLNSLLKRADALWDKQDWHEAIVMYEQAQRLTTYTRPMELKKAEGWRMLDEAGSRARNYMAASTGGQKNAPQGPSQGEDKGKSINDMLQGYSNIFKRH